MMSSLPQTASLSSRTTGTHMRTKHSANSQSSRDLEAPPSPSQRICPRINNQTSLLWPRKHLHFQTSQAASFPDQSSRHLSSNKASSTDLPYPSLRTNSQDDYAALLPSTSMPPNRNPLTTQNSQRLPPQRCHPRAPGQCLSRVAIRPTKTWHRPLQGLMLSVDYCLPNLYPMIQDH